MDVSCSTRRGFWYQDTDDVDAPGVNKYLTTELANHYRAGLTDIPGTHVYYWVYNSAFKNENVWWRYDNKTYTLVMGVNDPLGNCVVEEFGDDLPWKGPSTPRPPTALMS